jgi:mono/diheme cytochrome c family protein
MRGVVAAAVPLTALVVYLALPESAGSAPAHRRAREAGADPILDHAESLLEEGRRVFRDDTFGDEEFWGGQLRLHEAISGERLGGVGPGLSPRAALQLGLKVDAGAVPPPTVAAIQRGVADLDDPAVTVELLRAGAVIGVKGQFDDGGRLQSVGITCALCHSTVDDSVAAGIGRPLDGWPNRDLDVGAIVATAPSLEPFATLLGTDEDTVRTVLRSWGPGRYDAELVLDGKAFRPDGKTAATLLPAAFGLAGVNLHTYTGFGSVPYWNAYVANTQMHGKGTFFDPRLADPDRFPVAARAGLDDVRTDDDRITPKLAALHFYQLAIPAPRPPEGSFDAEAAERGRAIFEGKAKCATCHVPPLYTEPGWAMHTGAEIGIDDFQASRSPDGRYRTTPLRGLFTREKGGFYHDGRFATLDAVVDHYAGVLALEPLTDAEHADLVQFLKSL